MLLALVTRNRGLVQNIGELREVTDTATAALGALNRKDAPPGTHTASPGKPAFLDGPDDDGPDGKAPLAGPGAGAPSAARRRFWDCLFPTEQEILEALARREEYAAGAVLFRENHRADRVIVIEEGTVKVSVDAGGTDREIALRGPGDLIGERAMLLVRERSATVVALTPVRVLVASAGAFNAFLDEHPRVIAVLERQFYDRLTHDAAAPAGTPSPEV
ncbi:cyclic nucleotide-binding domain-containing protein, partial [Actinomadura rubrisoli]